MITSLFPPVVSGSSTFSFHLSKELAGLGNNVVLITPKLNRDQKDYEVINGIHIYRIFCWRLPKLSLWFNFEWISYTLFPMNFRRVLDIAKFHEIQIVNLHNHMFDTAFLAIFLRKKIKVPLVVTLHTIVKHSNSLLNVILNFFDSLILKNLIIANADKLISPDKNVEEYAFRMYSSRPSKIIPYGISKFEQPEEKLIEHLTEKYNLKGKRILVSLGHLHENRNRKELIEALPDVLKIYPDLILVIVGSIGTSYTADLIKKLRLTNFVILTGALPHKESMALLSICELEIHWLNQDIPQKTSLGIASLEAMSAGKVIISSANENSYGEGILINDKNLILVNSRNPKDLSEKIISLLGSQNLCSEIGNNAKILIEKNFSWFKIGKDTLSLYQEALANNYNKIGV